MYITKESSEFLLSILPEWTTKDVKGVSNTFYGTGSQEGDN